MIALFSEPIEIEVLKYEGSVEVERQGLLLGIIRLEVGVDQAITVDPAGKIWYTDLNRCRTKWRYDAILEDWVDNVPAGDVT